MSSLLYSLGRWAASARMLVLTVWVLILALLGTGALLFSQGANAPISIPGTESQAAIDTLSHTFPEVSGSSATIIVVAAEGERVDEAPYRQAVVDAADSLAGLEAVTGVSTPFAEFAASDVSDNGRAALITIQMQASLGEIPAETEQGIFDATDSLQDSLPAGTQVSYGGDVFSTSIPSISITEAIGVVVAFFVLIFTLGSLLAAGMPLLIALLGVGISMAGILFATAFIEMTSTTPMLALMLGIALAIDYTLFIVSRHQQQLRAGMSVRDSIARATATSGSAVVFAGLTVVIALLGLSVAGIPFLTSLGVAAAAAVVVAVLIAITLTPAVLSMAGERILPRRQRSALAASPPNGTPAVTGVTVPNGAPVPNGAAAPQNGVAAPIAQTRAERFFSGWVKAATAKPIVTITAVLLLLGFATVPAASLRLALPGAETLAPDNPARVTYELTGEHFGEGANGPLLLTGSIITSTDPLGLMEDLSNEIRALDGVADVPLATPNQGADTGIIQVVPVGGPQAESTSELVAELRAHHDEWVEKYGVSLAVTGFTAVGIDISQLLFDALLPFGILVVGLSLVLLAAVFRSVWVPIKATLGYLLSVGAAFGAVVAVFQWGWLADLLQVHHAGPVLSFMPIILMGVLFGLAMDYQVFLVSRIREEVVHTGNSREAIRTGFVGSGRVVTAAAIIMIAVFAAFVPEGDPSIKVIALGLAVGVFVDAFIVRMTLVPAVLQLLGDKAWWMPRWLDRLLPAFDVEGEGITRELEFANWPSDAPDAVVASSRLTIEGAHVIPDTRVAAGEALVLDAAKRGSAAFAKVLTGRGPLKTGTLKVAGYLLPERAGSVRARSAWATPATLENALADGPKLLLLDVRGLRVDEVAETRAVLDSRGGSTPTLAILGELATVHATLPGHLRGVEPGDGRAELVAAGAPGVTSVSESSDLAGSAIETTESVSAREARGLTDTEGEAR